MNEILLQKARSKGADAQYLAWIRLWPSCLSGAYSEVVNGEGKCEACHVRRVAAGAGVAEKPEYSAIPLTGEEHAMTHQKGESVFCAPEWFDNQAAKYLTMWINGVRPPAIEEQRAHWKKEYIVEYPGQLVALYLLLRKHFSRKDAPNVKCTLQRAVKQRSNQQNKAQWGCIYDQALDYYKEHSGDLAVDALKSLKFGVNNDFMHEMFKRLFNGGRSTANLSTIQSKEYFERIREYFLHSYGFAINEPVSPMLQNFNQGE